MPDRLPGRPFARAMPDLMAGTMSPDDDALLDAARAARSRAHAPYSGFAVGAALRDEHGRVHAGANIENAAYPEGLCAEAVALAHLVMAGGTRVAVAAVVAESAVPVTPCGGCRQKLREFMADDAPVLCGDDRAVRLRCRFGELLPHSFGPAHLAGGGP